MSGRVGAGLGVEAWDDAGARPGDGAGLGVGTEMGTGAPEPMRRRIGGKLADPFQARVMAAVAAAIAGRRSGAVMGPVGSGKSLIAAAATLDALAEGRPVLLVQPTIELLQQNLALIMACPEVAGVAPGLLVARNERFPDLPGARRNRFGDALTLASNLSLTNKASDPGIALDVAAFGARGGLVLVDEGQGAAADGIGGMLGRLAKAGASGIVLTATPFRGDGRDPLAPFGTTVAASMIAVAGHDEVLAAGRTVPTTFACADAEFAARVGAKAIESVEALFEKLLQAGDSIEEASSKAMSRFFRSKEPGKQAIAGLLLEGMVGTWAARCATRTLTMFHCDSVDLAAALFERLAREAMPAGSTRAGLPVRVARATGSGASAANAEAFANGDRRARSELIERAREGAYDVVVNVRALSTGTDIPGVDCSFLACIRRGATLARQSSGRGERAAPGKVDHLLVDVGSTIVDLYGEMVAMREGREGAAGAAVRAIPGIVRHEYLRWFEGDPEIAAKVGESAREKARRVGGRRGRAEAVRRLPTVHAFAPGLSCAASRRRVDGALRSVVALVADLEALELVPPRPAGRGDDSMADLDLDPGAGPDPGPGAPAREGADPVAGEPTSGEPEVEEAEAPGFEGFDGHRYAVAVFDEASGSCRARMADDVGQALGFAVFHGLKAEEDPGTPAAARAEQGWCELSVASGLPWLMRDNVVEGTKAGVSAACATLRNAGALAEGIAEALASVAFERTWPLGRPRALLLEDVAAMEAGTLAAIRRYVAFRTMIRSGRARGHGLRVALASHAAARTPPAEVAAALGVAKGAVVTPKALTSRRAERGVGTSRGAWRELATDPGVLCWSPRGEEEPGWLRGLAGLPALDDDSIEALAGIEREMGRLDARVIVAPKWGWPGTPGEPGRYRLIGFEPDRLATMREEVLAAERAASDAGVIELGERRYALYVLEDALGDPATHYGAMERMRRTHQHGRRHGTPGRTDALARVLDARKGDHTCYAMIDVAKAREVFLQLDVPSLRLARDGLTRLVEDHLHRRARGDALASEIGVYDALLETMENAPWRLPDPFGRSR